MVNLFHGSNSGQLRCNITARDGYVFTGSQTREGEDVTLSHYEPPSTPFLSEISLRRQQ